MKNKKNLFIVILSAIFAVALTCTFIFSIKPTYAQDVMDVVITNTDGTSVYITGDNVKWDKTNNKYTIEKDTTIEGDTTIEEDTIIDVHVVNEYRIFQSIEINGVKYYDSFINDLAVSSSGGNLEIKVNARSPLDSDVGKYFSKPFVLSDDGYIKSLEAILAGKGTDADFSKFRLNETDTNDQVKAYLASGYFTLNDNILLDANEFYGIGTEDTPFSGCFDFKGFHVTLNILNQYKVSTPANIYSGFFGYVEGANNSACVIRNVDVDGKIAFEGSKGKDAYHYIGGVAGYAGPSCTFTDVVSAMSITTNTNSPMMVGGLYGWLNTTLMDRFTYTYACNYGVLQSTSKGADANISIGGLAGTIIDASVYSFTDKSIATHIVANNLGSGSHDSGTNAVGGVAGSVYAKTKNINLKNISMNIEESKEITSSIDSSEETEYSAAGGAYGVFDSLESYKISVELVPIKVNSGEFVVSSSTISVSSLGNLYSGGFIGYFDSTGHILSYDYDVPVPDDKITLFDGNAKVAAYQYGKGHTYAGGLFGYNALSFDGDITEKIILNSGRDGSTIEVLAEQNQTATLSSLYDICAGYFSSKVVNYKINKFDLTVNNGKLTAQRSVGSTAIGNVFAGGFAGSATADASDDYNISDVNINLNNSTVNAFSLSFDCVYKQRGNNAAAGGFAGFISMYGKVSASGNSTNGVTWGASTRGLYNVNVNINNGGVHSPEITIYCIQNATPGDSANDYFTEGYVGGVIGLLESSYVENINAISTGEKAIVYYNGTNSPNTAAAGGLVGETKDFTIHNVIENWWGNSDQYLGNYVGINGGKVRNLQVVCKAYSNVAKTGDRDSDIYCGGAVGTLATFQETYTSNLHVFDTSVHCIGEEEMLTYAGGITGGLWWTSTAHLSNCSFVSGYVYASSITNKAYAGGIAGYTRAGSLINNVVLNSYVDSVSKEQSAHAAGIVSFLYSNDNVVGNYSQSYISANGKDSKNSLAAGIAYADSNNNLRNVSDNYYDLASFGNSYLSNNDAVPGLIYGANRTTSTYNGNNPYIVLYEDSSKRYSSLQLDNPKSGNEISSASIYANSNNRFYVKLEGDTDSVDISNSNKTLAAKAGANGLIVSSLWININGLLNNDSTAANLKEEDGWYQFCSYAIKVNDGRPVDPTDELSVKVIDNDTNKEIEFDYATDSSGNYYRIDDGESKPYAVTDSTNVAGYYQYSDKNAQYILVNMGQTGFYKGDVQHVAQSIKINAVITSTDILKPNYQNFPKYSFYELSSPGTQFGLDESLWTVPYETGNANYVERIDGLLASSSNKVYSSNFNGRLSVDRLLDEYALVITPNSELTSRTIIMIEYENGTEESYKVIIEFVPNTIDGLIINPAEDTPALEVTTNTDVNSDGINDTVYTYVGGDTIRFEAKEDKRYTQLSFLANVKFKANSDYGIKTNGQVNVPATASLFPVECELLSNKDINGIVYVRVLTKVTLSFNTTGATYESDRLAVQNTPFKFSFNSSPGFGLAPEKVTIKTSSNTYELAGSNLTYSKTESYENRNIKGCLVSFDSNTETYSVVVDKSLMNGITSLDITIVYPVVYSIVFDTGIPNVKINQRYIVYTLKENTVLDSSFYNQVYGEVFGAIKDDRYGFTLQDYYLTDEASSIPRYGDTFVTMTNLLEKKDSNGNLLYYYYTVVDSEGNITEVKVFENPTTHIFYKDVNKNGVYDESIDKTEYFRKVTGPYTFYARWTYDIALEIPDGVTISSPLDHDKVVELDKRDPDILNGKQNLVPINTMDGFAFSIDTDSSFEGTPRFKLYEVVRKDDTFIYTDLTNKVSLLSGSSSTYYIPQYDDEGKSLINGILFLKVFSETIDFEVSDIGEFGKVSSTNDIYEDGIFTTTYGINYTKVKIGDIVYTNGIPVANTAGGNGVQFKFTNGSGSNLNLPTGTSLRVYRHINGEPYDSGSLILNSATNIVNINDFIDHKTGNNMSLDGSLLVKSEQYNLVVTLPKGYTGYSHIKNAKVIVVTNYTEACKQFAYTLTYEYDSNGDLVAVQPKSYDVLMSPTRHESFNEKAFDIFNVYSYNPASGLVTRLDAPTEQASGFTLQFTPSSGFQANIYDHRHGSSYYLWEVEKTYSTDETGASVIRQYTAKDASGNDVSVVSETQHHYYYLATNGNLTLSNVPSGCKIRLLEVDSITNPAAGVVIYTYPAN